MQDLISFWKANYYTTLLLSIVLCVTFIISLKNRKKFQLLKYIPLYTITLFLVCLSSDLHSASHIITFLRLTHYLDYFFTLLELIIFSHFYYYLINNRIIKKTIIPVNLAFFVFYVYMLVQDESFYKAVSEKTQTIVYTIEGLILLLVCLTYFIELFKKPAYLNLKNDPAFWVSTGLLFFLTCTLPFSVLENYITNSELISWLYPIFYIFYILLFSMIIRAYLCTREKPNTALNNC